ncbi:MAG: hypothetical protein ACT4TC_16880 [Myxococcaceae bacterium]
MEWLRIRPALAQARRLIPAVRPEPRIGAVTPTKRCASSSALDVLTEDVRREVADITERLAQKGLTVRDSLPAKLKMLEKVIALAKRGETWPFERLHEVHNALLIDLNPAQLTQLRDGLYQLRADAGQFVQLPKRPVPGLPAKLGEVNSLLTGISHRPAGLADVQRAPENLAASSRTALGEEAKRFAEGGTNPLPVLPSTLKSAEKKLAKIQRELQTAAGNPARQRSLIAARATLTTLIEQMQLSDSRSALSRTRGLVGVVGGASLLPNLAAAYVEAGVSFGVKGMHTRERRIEPYAILTGSTAIASPGYFASKSQSRSCWTLNAPFLGMGSHPVLGKTVCVFVPGLFTFQVGSAGALNLKVMAPFNFFGLFGGVAILVSSPKLAPVTGPVVEAAMRTAKTVGKPLAPIAQRAGTLWGSARARFYPAATERKGATATDRVR